MPGLADLQPEPELTMEMRVYKLECQAQSFEQQLQALNNAQSDMHKALKDQHQSTIKVIDRLSMKLHLLIGGFMSIILPLLFAVFSVVYQEWLG